MRRGFAACLGALVVAAGVAATRPAAAFEAWDGRLQVHGFGETIARSISSNFTDEWDLTQWQFLLNVEVELDIAPDGWGPFTALSAYTRLEFRYDCIWRRGCGMFPNVNAYGDRAVRGANWFTDGADIATVYRGTSFANGNSPPEGGRISPRGDYVRVGDHPVFAVLNDAAGPDGVLGTRDDPGPLVFQQYDDYTLTSRRVRGSTNGEGRQDYGPWRPKEFISPIGALVDRGNCLSPIENCVVTGGTFPGRDKPFRPYPVRSAEGPYDLPTDSLLGLAQPATQARGLYIPSMGLIDFFNDQDTTFTTFDQNFNQSDLEWNFGGSQQDERELRELYLDMEFFDGRLFVRAGRQTIVWGKTELFRTTDQFNPQDVGLSTLPSLEESRIPLWSVRAIYSFYDVGPLEDVRLELAANIDQFEPTDIGRCGEPYAPIPACQKAYGLFVHGLTGLGLAGEIRPPAPWEDIRGLEFGGRLEWRWRRFSFALTDFFGYKDSPTVDPLYTYTRSVDPRTGRPRFGFSEGGCDPENLFDGDTRACLGTQRTERLPAEFQGRVPPVTYTGFPFSSPTEPQPGRITASRNSNLKGRTFNEIRETHSVNQQFYHFLCAGTVGFSSLFPGLESECSFSVFGSGVTLEVAGAELTVAEALGQILGGSNILIGLLGTTGSGIVDALAPPNCCLLPLLPLNTLDRRTGEGAVDNLAVTITFLGTFQVLPLSNISAAFTPEQQSLLGCGAFYGTSCDLDGVDLMNAEASALLQSFPGFDGTPLFGFDIRQGPQPGTVGFPGGQPCGRFERGHFFILPGCRGPGDPGYDPDVDGEPLFQPRVPTAGIPTNDPLGDITGFNASKDILASFAGTRPCPDAQVGDRLFHPLTCAAFRSEMAALSWNFLALTVLFSGDADADLNDPENFDVYDPQRPFAKGRCSIAQPMFCSAVRALLQATGAGRQDLRAAGNRRFGRRDFVWHTGREFVFNYDKRNILGLSLDFAEDVAKTNWSMEATWFSDVRFSDRDARDGNTSSDVYNLTISMDRPTFVNFLNANRTIFFNTQLFIQYIPQHTDSFSANGPVNVLTTFTATTGYFQDRLLTAMTGIYDFQSNSGAVLPSFIYRFTQSFSAQVGLAYFFGGFDIRPPFLYPASATARVGASAYSDFVENGLSILRHRDELFMRIRYTF